MLCICSALMWPFPLYRRAEISHTNSTQRTYYTIDILTFVQRILGGSTHTHTHSVCVAYSVVWCMGPRGDVICALQLYLDDLHLFTFTHAAVFIHI